MLYATREGHFPVIEYLVEKGADMEAKNKVSDVIIDVKSHIRHT